MSADPETLALDDLAALLDGREWNASDFDRVAEIVRSTGRYIGPPRASLDEQVTLKYVVDVARSLISPSVQQHDHNRALAKLVAELLSTNDWVYIADLLQMPFAPEDAMAAR